MEVSGQLHSWLPYPQGKVARYPWEGRLGSPRSSLDATEEINLLLLPAVKSHFLGYVGCSLITIPTKLSWLLLRENWTLQIMMRLISLGLQVSETPGENKCEHEVDFQVFKVWSSQTLLATWLHCSTQLWFSKLVTYLVSAPGLCYMDENVSYDWEYWCKKRSCDLFGIPVS